MGALLPLQPGTQNSQSGGHPQFSSSQLGPADPPGTEMNLLPFFSTANTAPVPVEELGGSPGPLL